MPRKTKVIEVEPEIESIGSIRLSSNQQILLHNCIEKLHSARQCPMKIVNLTLRSALDFASLPIEETKLR